MPELISKEGARLCASIVKEVACAQGLVGEPSATGRLTVSGVKLYNKGLRDCDQPLAAALLVKG